MTAHPTVTVAANLTRILDLYARLHTEAEHRARDRLMPGGEALAALAPVANLEAWEWREQTTERTGVAYTSAADEDPDDAWSAYQLIEFWSEAWRRERGWEWQAGDRQPTIATEANFVRDSLTWAWDHEPHFDDFAADMTRARTRLETILRDGNRADRSHVTCTRCEPAPRLVRVYAPTLNPDDDRWRCPNCRQRYDSADLDRARASQARTELGHRHIRLTDARWILRQFGHPDHRIRVWLDQGEGAPACHPGTRDVLVYWPDLWRRHLIHHARASA